MTIFQNPGASIEGNKLELNFRRRNKPIVTSLEISGVQTTVYLIKGTRSSIATITEELNPKHYRVNPKSKLDLGDTLKAISIMVYFLGDYDFELIANYTSKHPIQKYNTHGFSYAIINTPFRYSLEFTEKEIKEIGGKNKKSRIEKEMSILKEKKKRDK